MAELRCAVIGAGQMGTHHVNAFERAAGAELVAVADPDEATAKAAIGRRPVSWEPHWQALIERDDVDAVSIAVPSEFHAEVALAALDAGKHVLVEKPIATTIADGQRMEQAATAKGRKLMVGHVERFNPAVGKVAELMQLERLGRIYRAAATRSGPIPARIKDTGVAIDLATHDLDIMQHVLSRQITQVYAERAQFQHASQEDMLTCLLRFGDDGPFGLLDVNWLTPEKRRELTILGESGLLRADYLSQDVWFIESATTLTGWDELARIRGDAEGAVLRFALRKQEPLLAELEAFVQCVVDDTPEPVTAREGTQVLAAALALRESAERGQPIAIADASLQPAASL
jgi:UDP-N-acetylglucosamine 3-dehydrogenase